MKKRKMAKVALVSALALALALPVFAGGRASSGSGGNTMRDITILIYGDKTDRMAQYMATDIPKLLAEKGLNIRVDLQVAPWTDYASTQVELRYASGEDFATWTDMPFLSRCQGKGYLLDITNLIDQHAPNVRREIDAASFDSFSINGRNYALPVGNKPNASEFFAVTLRQDLLEEIGMKEIKTIEDLERFAVEGKKRHPDYIGIAEGSPTDTYGAVRLLSRYISDKNILFLNELVFTDASANNAQIWSYLESDEFKKYAEIARRWNQLGIIDQRVLSDGTIANSKYLAAQALFRNGNAGRPWEEVGIMKAQNPNAKLRSYFIGDAKGRPLVSRGTYSTAFQLSVNSKHPEAFLQFINLIYSDRTTYNYMTYGIEGVDYTLNSAGKIATRPTPQVMFPEWCNNNSKWQLFESIIDDAVINDYLNWNKGSILQKDIGFIFDLEPVKVEYAQIQAVVNEYVPPIALGFRDYASAYPELQRRLKNAGIDKYMTEYQKQFSDWYAKKK